LNFLFFGAAPMSATGMAIALSPGLIVNLRLNRFPYSLLWWLSSARGFANPGIQPRLRHSGDLSRRSPGTTLEAKAERRNPAGATDLSAR
jgi:hypothetical protein